MERGRGGDWRERVEGSCGARGKPGTLKQQAKDNKEVVVRSWLEVAAGGGSSRLVLPGSAGSHIPPSAYCLRSHFIMQSCLWRGKGKARARTHADTHTHEDRSALHSDVCLNPSAAPAGEGRGGERSGRGKKKIQPGSL